jgi:hypothetical protein
MCVCHDKAEYNKKRKKTCERKTIMTRTAACKWFINTHKKEKMLSSLSTTAVLMGKKNDRRIDKNYREKKKVQVVYL